MVYALLLTMYSSLRFDKNQFLAPEGKEKWNLREKLISFFAEKIKTTVLKSI